MHDILLIGIINLMKYNWNKLQLSFRLLTSFFFSCNNAEYQFVNTLKTNVLKIHTFCAITMLTNIVLFFSFYLDGKLLRNDKLS